MKRYLLSIVLLSGILLFTGNLQRATAQIDIGGGLAYGSEIENLGIRADGVYTINEQFRAGANITFFLPKEMFPGVDWTWWEINANGHYLFPMDADVNVYGLAGLNFVNFKAEGQTVTGPFGNTFSSSYSDSAIGLNIGGGAEYPLDFANLYGELKYTLSDYDQLAINVGLRFAIGS